VKKTFRSLLALPTLLALALLAPAGAGANDRQKCLNDCTQTGQTETRQCQATHDQQMIACGKLQTNEERNTCKSNAAKALRDCAEKARQKVKTCQEGCPPKQR
jgi:hypothetical protein